MAFRPAEREEGARAPHPEMAFAADAFAAAQRYQLVVDRPRNTSFKSLPYKYIGSRFFRHGIVNYANWMCLVADKIVIDIGAEAKALRAAHPFAIDRDRHEGRILDDDPAHLGRGDQPVGAVGFPAEYGGKQSYQGLTADRRALIVPHALAVDSHVQIAAQGWHAVCGIRRRRHGFRAEMR